MNIVDVDQLAANIEIEEGFVSYPYDDKTEKRVEKGYTVVGTVTFGHGLTFLTEEESDAVVRMRGARIAAELLARLPWIASLSEPRRRALVDMAYNLGIAGLEEFTTFLGMMQSGHFDNAADDLKVTPWASEVGSRAKRIEAEIRAG